LVRLHFAGRVPAALQFAGRAGTIPITRNPNEVEGRVELYLPRQIGQKNRRAFEHADKNDGLARKVLRDLLAQFGHALGDVLPRNQHLEFCHGVSY
jgi:hypothetical protein